MEIIQLDQDGRCRWLDNKVLKGLLPMAIRSADNPASKKHYFIVDWISNDSGKVGVDLKWFKNLGVPAVQSYKDLPKGNNYTVINTGYDSIVSEEIILKKQGVDILDKPCPFIRRLRKIFESCDNHYQYVYLCEPNHITVKNFTSIFPKDMILVQINNYKEKIIAQQNGKPLKLIPYVTFIKSKPEQVFSFIQQNFPERDNSYNETSCLWVKSKASPIIEIEQIAAEKLKDIKDALLIATPGSDNQSLKSMEETIANRGLNVVKISSLFDFWRYKITHNKDKVLLVKSPIPNNAEAPIMAYIDRGWFATINVMIKQTAIYRKLRKKLKMMNIVKWLNIYKTESKSV
jgi:4-hydroxy-3-methylbut-2-enyl diphosphate reductase IspH